jgi:hypothetical protein
MNKYSPPLIQWQLDTIFEPTNSSRRLDFLFSSFVCLVHDVDLAGSAINPIAVLAKSLVLAAVAVAVAAECHTMTLSVVRSTKKPCWKVDETSFCDLLTVLFVIGALFAARF